MTGHAWRWLFVKVADIDVRSRMVDKWSGGEGLDQGTMNKRTRGNEKGKGRKEKARKEKRGREKKRKERERESERE